MKKNHVGLIEKEYVLFFAVNFIFSMFWVFALYSFQLSVNGRCELCINDVCNQILKKCIMIYIPSASLIIVNKLKYDYRMNVIVRQKKMQSFYIFQIKDVLNIIMKLCISMTLIILIVAILVKSDFSCNWTDTSSYLSTYMGFQMEYSFNGMLFFAVTIATIFIQLFMAAVIIMTVWWWTGHPIGGVAVITVLSVMEVMYPDLWYSAMFSLMRLDVEGYAITGRGMGKTFMADILMCIVAATAGMVLYRKKDWLNNDIE